MILPEGPRRELLNRTGVSRAVLARDAALVAVAVSIATVVADAQWVKDTVPHTQAVVGMTVLAVAVALAISMMWMLAARLTHDGRATWVASAFAVYGLVAVPATTLGSAFEAGRAATGAARISAHAVMAVMLVVASWPALRRVYARGVGFRGVMMVVVALAIPAVAAALALLDADVALAVSGYMPIRVVVSSLWLVAAVLAVYRGLVHQIPTSIRSGLGILVLALAHSYRLVSEAPQPAGLPNLTFTSVRLVGLLIVLSAAYDLSRQMLQHIDDAELEQQEQLMVVEEGLARRAALAHELRNGIAGIAGVTTVLGGPTDSADRIELRTVVHAELGRLDALLSPDRSEKQSL